MSRLRPRADFYRFGLYILGDIDDDRAGTSRGRNTECGGDHFEQFCGGTHQEVVFGDRDGQAIGVDLLKGVGADQGARHLAGDGDDRDRVELRVGDGGQQVGRPRS